MTDPLSVTASVVGIASFGIEMCTKLLEIYDSAKNAKSDVQDLCESATALSQMYKTLQDVLNRSQHDTATLKTAKERILACESGLKRLEKKLDKVRRLSTDPTSLHINLSLRYAFKQKTISKLKQIVVQDQLANLALAMTTLNLEVSMNIPSALHSGMASVNALVNDFRGETHDGLDRVEKGVSSLTDAMEQFRLADERDDIISWSSASDRVGVYHNDTCRLRALHTGDWFMNSQTFQRWKQNAGSVLWLIGGAGCGKTVLCSSIITEMVLHCNLRPANYLAYFYFSFSDNQRQSVESFLRSIIRQLLLQRTSIPDRVRDIYKRFKHSYPPLDAWIQALQVLINLYGQTFIIIDAMDECPSHHGERALLLQTLQRLKPSQGQQLHILATSRKEADIEASLLDMVSFPPLNIQNSNIDNDIRVHVKAQLENHAIMSTWPIPIQEEVEEILTSKAGGMFRWVACQLESLQKCLRASTVRKTLQSLPQTLDETYERILLSIAPEHQQEAIAALNWLVFSKTQPTVAELAEASVIDVTSRKPFEVAERLFDPNSIVNILSGLVSVIQSIFEPNKVRLAHFSVEEYLVSKRIMNGPACLFRISLIPSTHNIVASCLYYLQSPDLLSYKEPWSKNGEARIEFPLLRYALRNWPEHVNDCRGSTPEWLLDVIFRFFDCQDSFKRWRESYDFPQRVDIGCCNKSHLSRFYSSTDPFYYACRFVMFDVVQAYLGKKASKNIENNTKQVISPGLYADELRVACYFDHEDVVFELLNAGADHTHVGGGFKTALGASMQCSSPNEHIIKRLLELRNELRGSDALTGFTMRWAVRHNHVHIVDLILSKVDYLDPEFDWTRSSRDGSQIALDPYIKEAESRSDGALNQGSYSVNCSSPYQAAFLGYYHILERFMDMWHNVDESDESGRTALYWATFHQREDIVRLLLQKGASPDVVVDGYGWTPRWWASEFGNEVIVALLHRENED